MTIASSSLVFPANAESITGNADCNLQWDAQGDECGTAVSQLATRVRLICDLRSG